MNRGRNFTNEELMSWFEAFVRTDAVAEETGSTRLYKDAVEELREELLRRLNREEVEA